MRTDTALRWQEHNSSSLERPMRIRTKDLFDITFTSSFSHCGHFLLINIFLVTQLPQPQCNKTLGISSKPLSIFHGRRMSHLCFKKKKKGSMVLSWFWLKLHYCHGVCTFLKLILLYFNSLYSMASQTQWKMIFSCLFIRMHFSIILENVHNVFNTLYKDKKI